MLFHQKYLVKIFMSPNHHEFFAFDYIIYKKLLLHKKGFKGVHECQKVTH